MINPDLPANSNSHLMEGVGILKGCRPLITRLAAEGVTISLTNQEKSNLLSFKTLVQADYSDREWSFLRIASGTKINEIAALTSCLNRYEDQLENQPKD